MAFTEVATTKTPEEIKALKKAELLAFISEMKLELDIAGKKIGEVKDMVVDASFNPVSAGEDEDIIVE